MNLFDLYAKIALDDSEYTQGIDKAVQKGSDASKKLEGLGTAVKNAGKTFATIGAGAAAAGGSIFAFANKVSQNADTVDKMSQKLGLSAQAYQEWDYVLKISGTEMANMSTGLKTLTNKFDEAVNGSDSAIETFSRLGLSMDEISGLSREDLFSTVITAFQNMEDSAERAALANDLFGKSGQELAPLFNTTAEETQRLIEQVNDLGGVMSDDAVKNGAAFQDALTGVKTAFSGAANSLAAELIPKITELMNGISNFVAEGGLQRIIDWFTALSPILAAAAAAMVAYKAASAISGVIQALTSATEGQTIAQTLLNAVMNANPFVLVATLIAGLVTALITLWTTNEGFREAVSQIWESIKGIFSGAWEAIKGVWSAVTGFFSGIWSGIKGVFSGVGSWFSEKFTAAKEGAANAWSNAKAKFSERWEQIKSAFSSAGSWFSSNFQTFRENAVNAWSNIKSRFSDVWSRIKSAFSIGDALSWGRDMLQNFINGIGQKIGALVDKVKGIGQTIRNFLGFSEPKMGPLSNFHTFAPDMMALFAKGIKDNEDVVTDQINKSFNLEPAISAASVPSRGVSGRGGSVTFGNIIINIATNAGENIDELAQRIGYALQLEVEKRLAADGA